MTKSHPQRGAALLLTILIIGVVAFGVMAALSRISLSALEVARLTSRAMETEEALQGCIDEAIIQLKKNADFANANIDTGAAVCTLSVSANTTQREATITLSDGEITRRAIVTVETDTFAVMSVREE